MQYLWFILMHSNVHLMHWTASIPILFSQYSSNLTKRESRAFTKFGSFPSLTLANIGYKVLLQVRNDPHKLSPGLNPIFSVQQSRIVEAIPTKTHTMRASILGSYLICVILYDIAILWQHGRPFIEKGQMY